MEVYRPVPKSLEPLGEVDLIGVVGISGAGKSTIMNGAIEADPSIHRILNTSSRPLRRGERDGIDFHVRSEADMRRRMQAGEYVVAFDNLTAIYALAPEDCQPGTNVVPMAVKSIAMYQALPFRSFKLIHVLPPSYRVWWRERMPGHDIPASQMQSRLDEAKISLAYTAASDGPIIINNSKEAAIAEFLCIIQQGKSSTPVEKGCTIAQELLDGVNNTSITPVI